MAGLLKLSSLLGQGRWTFGLRTQVLCENILEELGQRLISYYHDSSNKVGFLVTGVRLETDLATSWEAKITQYEVRLSEERWGNGILSVNLPSAFQIFVMLGDYQGPQAVVDECPGGFTTHGVKGWKAAVQAFTTPDEAAEKFAEAAEYFDQDTRPDDPDELRARGSWSSANIDLWAKYFRSRSALAFAGRDPKNVKKFIAEAADAIKGTEVGWHDSQVSKYAILIRYLAHLLGQGPGMTAEDARR